MRTAIYQSILATTLTAALVTSLPGAVLVNDTFATFTNGNLVGQNSWAQTGSATANPLQVSGGSVQVPMLTGDNQDAAKSYTLTSNTAGTQIAFAIRMTMLDAPTTGPSYFVAMEESSFFDNFRVAGLELSPTTYQLQMRATGQTANPFVTTGASLNYGTEYLVMGTWDFVAGAQNDLVQLFVNPTSSTQGSNTVYASQTQGNATADPTAFQTILFSQFQSGTVNPSNVAIHQVVVANTFAEAFAAVAVPEPSMSALVLFGAMGLFGVRRRR
ncbi:MAG: PEP-CTERM sorting domain-containing protein [Roseimicrobium sp.]